VSYSVSRNSLSLRWSGIGVVCQPHCDSVQSGVAFSYSSGKVCRPVTSQVKANSPLPTDSGEHGSNFLRTGLCLETSAKRSIFDGCPNSSADLILARAPPPTAAPMNVRRVTFGCFNFPIGLPFCSVNIDHGRHFRLPTFRDHWIQRQDRKFLGQRNRGRPFYRATRLTRSPL
jgi:hypothetical protein